MYYVAIQQEEINLLNYCLWRDLVVDDISLTFLHSSVLETTETFTECSGD